jgi:2-keto-4-pentenoate hydratase/2-oxohepta-3-ene-1,7-dioic acid hydratase in catechol pathway
VSISLIRYLDDAAARWGVVTPVGVIAMPSEYETTGDVLADGAKAAHGLVETFDGPRLDLADLELLHPTPGARIFCQGANYRSHMIESGMDPDRPFNMLFTKSTASLAGPTAAIVRPSHVKLLDYEVELGIVVGKQITGAVTVTDDNLADYVGGFVVANDVSARDIQLPQGQWFKGKSYPTFCPVGPFLVVPDTDELSRWRSLRLTLSVNGQERQNSLAGDMVFQPAATLTELSGLETLEVGDLILTGTPGGCALQPPPAPVQKIASLLPEGRRWELFVKSQARSSAYLKPGDEVVASIRTDDGALDLGTQRNVIR